MLNTLVIFISALVTALFAAAFMLWRKVKEQEKLLKQDESLQSLFENQNEAWVIFDAESLIAIRANQKALNLFGIYRLQRLEQLSFKNIFREPLTDDEVQLLYSAIDQETFVNRNLQCSGTNGRAFRALVSITRVYEGNLFCRFSEEPVRFEMKHTPTLPVGNQVEADASTYFQKAESQTDVVPNPPTLSTAAQEMSSDEPVNNSNLPLVWINNKQEITAANESFVKLTGYTLNELQKLHFNDLTHPAATSNKQQLHDLTSSRIIYYSEERTLLRKDSKKIIVRCQGMMTGQSGIALIRLEDVTEQKAIEKELLFTRDNLKAVVEHTSEAIFSVDALDKIMVVNAVYRDRFFGKYGIWLKQGMNYGDALPKEERSAWRKTLNEVLRGKIINSREQFTNITGGNEEFYEVNLHPVYSGEHHLITGASYFARNITAQIAHEKELQESREIAEKATEAKSRFLATMTHEIRQPLNGIIGMTELLRATNLNSEQQQLLNKIRVSGDALLQVINEVLDYSRIEADKMELESVPFLLEKVVDETMDILSSKAIEKQLILEKIIQPSTPAVIIGDKARMRQVLVNLVSNAIKFTPNGFVKIYIETKQINDSPGLLITVEDSGIGMTKEETSRLFQEYQQADAATFGRYGGSGLGLTISKRIVELMHGSIHVESEKGKGSRFSFHFPFVAGSINDVEINTDQAFRVEANLATNYPLQILVAEDNDVNQLLMVNILRQLGYKAEAAYNGVEVLKKIEEQEFDLLFMDVQMPEMDGLEATRRIIAKNKNNRPVIISMTGFATDEDKKQCFDAGVDDYISKPVLIEDIQRMIKKWSGNRRSTLVKETKTATAAYVAINDQLKEFQILDTAAVQRLRDIAAKTDAAFVNQVIGLFEKQVPEGIFEIKEAFEVSDSTKLWQTAHKLKGTCLNVGAKKLAELLRSLEIKGKNGDLRNMDDAIQSLQPLFETTLIDFRRELSGENR